MEVDKKRVSDAVRFVLVPRPGQAIIKHALESSSGSFLLRCRGYFVLRPWRARRRRRACRGITASVQACASTAGPCNTLTLVRLRPIKTGSRSGRTHFRTIPFCCGAVSHKSSGPCVRRRWTGSHRSSSGRHRRGGGAGVLPEEGQDRSRWGSAASNRLASTVAEGTPIVWRSTRFQQRLRLGAAQADGVAALGPDCCASQRVPNPAGPCPVPAVRKGNLVSRVVFDPGLLGRAARAGSAAGAAFLTVAYGMVPRRDRWGRLGISRRCPTWLRRWPGSVRFSFAASGCRRRARWGWLGWNPFEFAVKEPIAVLNGTPIMTGVAVLVVDQCRRILAAATRATAIRQDPRDGRARSNVHQFISKAESRFPGRRQWTTSAVELMHSQAAAPGAEVPEFGTGCPLHSDARRRACSACWRYAHQVEPWVEVEAGTATDDPRFDPSPAPAHEEKIIRRDRGFRDGRGEGCGGLGRRSVRPASGAAGRSAHHPRPARRLAPWSETGLLPETDSRACRSPCRR